MITVQDQLTLEKKLAEALGWINIVSNGSSLLGKPPTGLPECRGQALIPAWTRDWAACGLLIGEYNVRITPNTRLNSVYTMTKPDTKSFVADYEDYSCKHEAIMWAIVEASLASVLEATALNHLLENHVC